MCMGHESSLLDCVTSDEIGMHDCQHTEDAGVRCEGEQYHSVELNGNSKHVYTFGQAELNSIA